MARPTAAPPPSRPADSGLTARRLVTGTGWALAGRTIGAASAFAFTVYAARHLSPAEFAGFALVLSLGSAAIATGVIGLDQAVVKVLSARLGAARGASLKRYASVCLAAAAASAVLVAVLVWWPGKAWVLPALGVPAGLGVAGAMAVWVGVGVVHRVLVESLRGLHEIRFAAQLAGIGKSGSLWGLGVLACMAAVDAAGGLDLVGAVTSLALANTALLVLSLVLVVVFFSRARPVEAAAGNVPVGLVAAEVAGIALPLAGAAVFRQLRLSADLWLLGALAAATEVAAYGASARAMVIVMLPITVVNAVLPPIVAETYASGDRILLERVARTAASASGLVALALTLAIVLVGRPGLAMIFGDFYGGAYPIIVLLALGQLVAVLAGPCGILLSMTGGQGVLLKAMGAATVGILLLGIPAAIVFGAVGMAAASLLVTAGQNVVLAGAVKRRLGVRSYASVRSAELRDIGSFLRQRKPRRTVEGEADL